MWAYVAGCQLLDVVWGALVAAGVEKVRFDPSLPGSQADLVFMPYSHSLPAALIWAGLTLAGSRFLLHMSWRT